MTNECTTVTVILQIEEQLLRQLQPYLHGLDITIARHSEWGTRWSMSTASLPATPGRAAEAAPDLAEHWLAGERLFGPARWDDRQQADEIVLRKPEAHSFKE